MYKYAEEQIPINNAVTPNVLLIYQSKILIWMIITLKID